MKFICGELISFYPSWHISVKWIFYDTHMFVVASGSFELTLFLFFIRLWESDEMLKNLSFHEIHGNEIEKQN